MNNCVKWGEMQLYRYNIQLLTDEDKLYVKMVAAAAY